MKDVWPLVWIVIPHWNGFQDTAACLESLRRLDYPNYRVLVVDNGSTDHSPARLGEEFPEVEWLAAKENLGFAGGCNLGVARALENGAGYVLLLNNDTVPEPASLRTLVEAAEGDPKLGIVGPSLLEGDRGYWTAGARRQRWTLLPSELVLGRGEAQDHSRLVDVDYIYGSAMLVKRRVWLEVGLLDRASFMYGEDLDFCLRAARSGYRVQVLPSARVVHRSEGSTRGNRSQRRRYRCQGRAWLVSKHSHGAVERTTAYLYLLVSALRMALADAGRRDARSALACLGGTLRGWRDGAKRASSR